MPDASGPAEDQGDERQQSSLARHREAIPTHGGVFVQTHKMGFPIGFPVTPAKGGVSPPQTKTRGWYL